MKKSLLTVLAVVLLALFFLSGNALADSDDVRTLILSNENGSAGGSGLIDMLIAAGHGDDNLYEVLQLLAADPAGGIPADFVASVGNNPDGSDVFTATLNDFAGLNNNTVGINADGTINIAAIFGRHYDGDAGFVTNYAISGIGSVWYTLATNSSYFIDTGFSSDSGSNHLAIGIAWIKARDARTFMLSNEAPGYLIDKLVAAGYENPYQALQFLAAQPGSGIPADFVAEVGSHPGSDAFTAALSDLADPSNNPIAIGDDGSLIVSGIYGRDYDGQSGFETNTVHYSGIGMAKVTLAVSPAYYIDAGVQIVTASGRVTYKVFGIAWADDVLTFVLSNEAPGYLIDELIADGYGSSNLYQVLVALAPASGGVISEAFLTTLANCPDGSEIFTAPLSNYTGINNPVCVNEDGTIRINDIFGRDYHGQTGYATYPESGGRQSFTYATSPQYYIDAGSSATPDGTTYYKAFAIAWSGEEGPVSDDPRTLVLSNERGPEGEGGLIDMLIAAGHGDDNLYEVLQLLAADPASGIPADFVASVGSNPPGSEVFTAALSNFAGLNGPVCINADGTLGIRPIFGRDYDGQAGFVTNKVHYSGIALANFTMAESPTYYIDAGASSGDGGRYQAIGIAHANNSRSFVISNEAPGYIIDKLIAAGHGSDNLYQVLQFLAAQPGTGIPADFVTEVGNNVPGSEVFTAALNNFSSPFNNPIGINADGTLIVAQILGRDHDGDVGFVTNNAQYSGIGPANFTMAASPTYYIDAGSLVTPGGITTYYQAIGIAWANDDGNDNDDDDDDDDWDDWDDWDDDDEFNEEYYLARYSDVAKAVNAAIFGTGWDHFLQYGENENRRFDEPDGYKSFNEAYYLARYPDVAKAVSAGAFGTGWEHYLAWGKKEGRSDSKPNGYGTFNEAYYLARYPDVAKAVNAGVFGTGWEHYLAWGKNEGRSYAKPNGYGTFNETYYLARYSDVAKAVHTGVFGTGWEHYLAWGKKEGRSFQKPNDYDDF